MRTIYATTWTTQYPTTAPAPLSLRLIRTPNPSAEANDERVVVKRKQRKAAEKNVTPEEKDKIQ